MADDTQHNEEIPKAAAEDEPIYEDTAAEAQLSEATSAEKFVDADVVADYVAEYLDQKCSLPEIKNLEDSITLRGKVWDNEVYFPHPPVEEEKLITVKLRDLRDIENLGIAKIVSPKIKGIGMYQSVINPPVEPDVASIASTVITEPLSTVTPQMEYLMKLIPADEGDYWLPPEEVHIVEEEIAETGRTETMRRAQRYLRVHKIFEFLQFITAHILGSLPENPIEFILDLLNKLLLYRSGFSEPPLLYLKKHLEVLFNLMDRMRTGFITLAQYKTGMITLGICSYNEQPAMNEMGMVPKEYFVDEAYESLVRILDDMLRPRCLVAKTRVPRGKIAMDPCPSKSVPVNVPWKRSELSWKPPDIAATVNPNVFGYTVDCEKEQKASTAAVSNV